MKIHVVLKHAYILNTNMIAFTVPKPETQGPTRVRVFSSLGTGEECRNHTVIRHKPEAFAGRQ